MGLIYLGRGTHRFSQFAHSQIYLVSTALQRTNTENLKQIFPEKEMRVQSSNFHIYEICERFIHSRDRSAYLLQEICGPILGIYKSLIDT
jgi:hypothetical protein